MYRLFLRGLLYAIRSTTPSESPDIVTSRDLSRPRSWWAPLRPIITSYGYAVDEQSLLVQSLLFLLRQSPVEDEEPAFTLSAHLEDVPWFLPIDHGYLHRLPAEATRPQSLDHFLMRGTGAFFLRRPDSVFDDYVVDFSHYEHYAVRPGLYEYGGKAHIREGRIHHYSYRGEHYDGEDALMERIFRATLSFELLASVHALRLHICTAQRKAFELRRRFPADHPLADLLYILTFGVLEINRKIALLLAPEGLVSRVFGFTPDAFADIVAKGVTAGPFTRSETVGLPGSAWYRKLTGYYGRVEKLISGILESAGIDDPSLCAELCDFFVASTALHNQVGDAQTYSMTTSGFLLPKVYRAAPGKISPLDYELAQTLLVAVSPRYPLLTDKRLESIFRSTEQARLWRRFVDDLRQAYSEEDWFNPLYFETSIGF